MTILHAHCQIGWMPLCLRVCVCVCICVYLLPSTEGDAQSYALSGLILYYRHVAIPVLSNPKDVLVQKILLVSASLGNANVQALMKYADWCHDMASSINLLSGITDVRFHL